MLRILNMDLPRSPQSAIVSDQHIAVLLCLVFSYGTVNIDIHTRFIQSVVLSVFHTFGVQICCDAKMLTLYILIFLKGFQILFRKGNGIFAAVFIDQIPVIIEYR